MSRPLHDKLRRLRREGVPPVDRRTAPKELPVWLRRKLRGRGGDVAATGGSPDPPAELVDDPAGWSSRTRRFAVDHAHGGWTLDEALAADPQAPVLLTGDRSLEAFDYRGAVYLDIEATGLSGGAGTIPFLVALGSFEGDGFTLWQGFLRGPEEEAAMLAEVARRVGEARAVVSFFGKSYDRHRLEDKMRLHGVDPPFDSTPHLDLYHPLARLVKGSLPDAKLQRLERELCGVERTDDLPGSFAPAAWFDFLRARPHRLEDVFRHNEDDVLSLVVLAAYLGSVERERRRDGGALAGCGRTRAEALARWFLKRSDGERAGRWAGRAVDRAGTEEERCAARLLRGDAARRVGDFERAFEDYAAAGTAGDRAVAYRAAVEEAKLAEHRRGDLPRALDAVRRASAHAETAAPGERSALERRRVRLEGKIERTR